MKTNVLLILNLFIVILFVLLVRKKGLLTYFQGGKVWLTWLAIAIITLMDELTSVFLCPCRSLPLHRAERHRFYRIHLSVHPLHDYPSRGNCRDPRTSRNFRRWSLFFFLPGSGSYGFFRCSGLHHGRLHIDRLHVCCERGFECDVFLPTSSFYEYGSSCS